MNLKHFILIIFVAKCVSSYSVLNEARKPTKHEPITPSTPSIPSSTPSTTTTSTTTPSITTSTTTPSTTTSTTTPSITTSTTTPSTTTSTTTPSTTTSTTTPSTTTSTTTPSTTTSTTTHSTTTSTTTLSTTTSTTTPSTTTSTTTPSTTTSTTTPSTTTSTTNPSTTTSTTNPDGSEFICSREDIANTGCIGPKDCLYPNPRKCTSYIQCTVNPDGSGTPVVMPCAGGLEWNDDDKTCDFPSGSTCKKVVTTIGTTQRPSFTCPREDITKTGCMEPKDCVYPNPGNCSTFIYCNVNPDGSGTPKVLPCYSGLEWNDNEKECVWPSRSTCNNVRGSTSITPTTPSFRNTTFSNQAIKRTTPIKRIFVCPRQDIAKTGCEGAKDCLYSNPGNCFTFIECLINHDGSGTPVVLPCPHGLEWNDNDKICDRPSRSTCD